jgi:hypothetical protein
MVLGQLKDLLRDSLGRRDLPTHLCKFFLDSGRRDIEKSHNFYWMRTVKNFNTVAAQGSYSITTGTTNGLNIPDFKDLRILFEKSSESVAWSPVETKEFEEAWQIYATDEEGEPEVAVFDNETLYLFPPVPDAAYNVRLYYWQWTANPTSNQDTDEVLTRWPELLLYSASAFGTQWLTKNPQLVQPFQAMFEREAVKVKRYSDDRLFDDQIDLTPRRGRNQFFRR